MKGIKVLVPVFILIMFVVLGQVVNALYFSELEKRLIFLSFFLFAMVSVLLILRI